MRMDVIRRVLQRLLTEMRRAMPPAAFVWRRLLPRTTFIAITGSFGKTTCTELVAAALSGRYRVARTIENRNSWTGVAVTILRTMPWHQYSVIEAATWQPGALAWSSAMIRPHIVIVLCVANTHRKSFRRLEDTGAEKERLFSRCAPGGLAVLNWDDARVAAMAHGRDMRVIRTGSGADCDVQGEPVVSAEPGRFSLRVRCGGEERTIHTRLYGPQWAPPVLAAVAVSRECGVPLEEASAAIERTAPFKGRLQLVSLPDGVQFLRDDYNYSMDSVAPALAVFDALPARRKVLVLSNIIDSRRSRRERAAWIAKRAARIAHAIVCVGREAGYGASGAIKGGMDPASVFEFETVKQTAEFLRGFLRPGDLVMAKGGGHLTRIFLSFERPVACWTEKCARTGICDVCTELNHCSSLEEPGASSAG
jgi:UDP-N-acetylmuramoyl-tripeptide--D-alanyl-D-alanine ligase